MYTIDDYQKIYQKKYPKNVLDLFSNKLVPILPESIKKLYKNSYQKYIQEKK